MHAESRLQPVLAGATRARDPPEGSTPGRGERSVFWDALYVGQVGVIANVGQLLAQIGQGWKPLPAAQQMIGR